MSNMLNIIFDVILNTNKLKIYFFGQKNEFCTFCIIDRNLNLLDSIILNNLYFRWSQCKLTNRFSTRTTMVVAMLRSGPCSIPCRIEHRLKANTGNLT